MNIGKKKPKRKRWERYLALAADAAAIARDLPRAPGWLKWVGVLARGGALAARARAETRRAAAGNPWRYFTDETQWIELPDDLCPIVLGLVGDVEIVDAYWDGDENSDLVCLGRVGGEQVGWIQDGDRAVDGPYVRRSREQPTYDAIGARLWRRLGTPHAAYAKTGLVRDALPADVVPTAQTRALEDRVRRFLACDIARSYLLVGPPGTGKSSAIRHLVRALAMTSLRVELSVLAERHGHDSDSAVATRLDALVKLLRPDVLILDDIDRLPPQGDLLHFLELAVVTCRVVLGSANATEKMMQAALRPGRFDEVVSFDRLDADVVERMIAPDADVAGDLRALPAAYVAEFVKRRRALGRSQAVAEIEELTRRAKATSGADSDAE